MKKIYLALLSAALLTTGVGVNAQTPKQALTPKQVKTRISEIQKSGQEVNEQTLAAKGIKTFGKIDNQIGRRPTTATTATTPLVRRAASSLDDSTKIIRNQPEGTLHATDTRSGFYSFSFFGNVMAYYYSGNIGTYVVSDDAIYIKDPLTGYTTDTWLKLDKVSDDRYVAHLPQPITVEVGYDSNYEDSTMVYYVARMKFDENSYYAPDNSSEDAANAYFTYKDGVLAMVDSTSDGNEYGWPDYALVLTDGYFNSFYGIAESSLKIEPIKETPTVLPSTATIESYELDATEYDGETDSTTITSQISRVAFDGNDVYINNPYSGADDSWIKGTITDGKAVFQSQYLGPDTANNVHVWFKPGTYKIAVDSSYYEDYGEVDIYRTYSLADALTFNYDATTKIFTAPDSTAIIINASPSRIYYIKTYDDAVLKPWAETAATPADPVITEVEETYGGDYGYGYSAIIINIPNTDTDGKLLNTDKAYYSIFLSDDPDNPYALTAEEGYTYYSADETKIPYTYSDGYDVGASGTTHYVYVYFDTADLDSVGVQSFYNGAGELRSSNLVWYSLIAQREALGIKSVEGNNSGVSKVVYYDLSGRQIARPAQAGIYVKETTFADGTRKGVKFIKK